MTQKLNLIVGFHNHISFEVLKNDFENEPVANYLRLIDLLCTFQDIKTVIHFSGNLISYLDKKSSSFSENVRNLLDRHQLELLSGGIYEPIFPFIPKEDRQMQLSLMNRLLDHTFGYTPMGAWVTESAWEPSLTLDLSKSRLQYTCLPKEYFTRAGLKESEISSYFITEEEGRKIAIFPVFYSINTLMQKYSSEDTVNNLLKSNFQLEKPLLVMFYEGGVKSTTQLDWLSNFLLLLNKNKDLIETRLFCDYFNSHKPKGRIYLGSIQDIRSQNTSGLWKHFLLKYPEANLLHKKMLRVSKKINSAKEGKSRFKVIKEMISQAQDLLLKGQSNNTYWDSTPSGIYSALERHNTYSNLIKAENIIDAASRQSSRWVQVLEIDYDCDGNDEVIIETETQNIYVSPTLGGTILEHDFRPKNINITNTVSRRSEAYHKVATQDEHSKGGNPVYDTYQKLNLIDHFLQDDLSLEKCTLNQLPYLTEEVIIPYKVEQIKAKEESCKITLNLITELTKSENKPKIELIKQINVRSGDSTVIVDYSLTNRSTSKVDFVFAVEFNLNATCAYDKSSYCYLDGNFRNKTPNPDLRASEEIKEINQISIFNNTQGIALTLSWNKPCNLYRCPIETLSYNSFEKLEYTYQGMTVLPTWHLTLEPDIPWELVVKQEISVLNPEQ